MGNVPFWLEDEIKRIEKYLLQPHIQDEVKNNFKILNNEIYKKELDYISNSDTLKQIEKEREYINRNLLPINELGNLLPESSENFKAIYTLYKDFVNESVEDENVVFKKKRNKIKIESKNDDSISLPISALTGASIAKNLVKDITPEDCFEFIDYLSKYPMLAYKHEVGVKIFKALQKLEHEIIENIEMFRIKKPYKIQRPYVEDEMYKAPFLKTDQGRFSDLGRNFIYFSEDFKTALEETDVKDDDKYTSIHVKLKTKKKVLDITDLEIPLFENCHKKADKNEKLEINYLIPNFISNCLNYLDYDGLISFSTMNFNFKNYTFFDCSKKDFLLLKINNNFSS